VTRRLNALTVRRPLAPKPRPVEDWSPYDFCTDPGEAWLLADAELQAEAAAAGRDYPPADG
jgi:hypothetical protein